VFQHGYYQVHIANIRCTATTTTATTTTTTTTTTEHELNVLHAFLVDPKLKHKYITNVNISNDYTIDQKCAIKIIPLIISASFPHT